MPNEDSADTTESDGSITVYSPHNPFHAMWKLSQLKILVHVVWIYLMFQMIS